MVSPGRHSAGAESEGCPRAWCVCAFVSVGGGECDMFRGLADRMIGPNMNSMPLGRGRDANRRARR